MIKQLPYFRLQFVETLHRSLIGHAYRTYYIGHTSHTISGQTLKIFVDLSIKREPVFIKSSFRHIIDKTNMVMGEEEYEVCYD